MGTLDKQLGDNGDQKSLSVYLNRIDQLTAPQAEQDYTIKDITRGHWRQWDGKSACSNRSCRKSFSLIDRTHHCRRCGDIFCVNCLKFRRKLNKLANLDPDGKSFKVCERCYGEGRETQGQMRSLTEEFRWLRVCGKYKSASMTRGQMTSSWRHRLDFEKEVKRLVEGFKGSVGTSEMKRTLQELRNMVSIPEWQKSSVWMQENTCDSCQLCRSGFGFLRKKLFCRVCGLAVCKTCSDKDLLIFYPDVEPGDKRPSDPMLAIIKIIGCPEREPEVSLYLRVCPGCREKVIERQISHVETVEEDDPTSDLLSQLTCVHSSFQKAENKINKHLPEYKEIVDSMEDNSRGSGSANGATPKSNMRTLAKAQGDLADLLCQHVLIVQRLKRLKPLTDTQNKLLKNYIKSKCDFYLENMFTYRTVRHRLSDSSPPEVLEFIQEVMDKNAVVSAHQYLRQLIYEMIAMSGKYKLSEDIPKLLTPLEEAMEEDVKQCVVADREDWEQHQDITQQLIKEQIKNHKLIRPSRRMLKRQGSVYADQFMHMRGKDVLTSISVQLQLKAANRRFPQTKKCLEEAIEEFPTSPES